MKKLVVLAFVLAACASPAVVPDTGSGETSGSSAPVAELSTSSTVTTPSASTSTQGTSTSTTTTTTGEGTVTTPKPPPEPLPLPPEIQPTGGEVPAEYLAAVKADAAERLGVSEAELSVDEAVSVVWPDGSLGCPQPGQNYIQVLIEGYRVVISAAGQSLDYRLDQRGHFRLCESGMPRLGQP